MRKFIARYGKKRLKQEYLWDYDGVKKRIAYEEIHRRSVSAATDFSNMPTDPKTGPSDLSSPART